MSVIRVSAVEYLNARPLVHGLEDKSKLFSLDFAVPAKCATNLHESAVELALIPSIEYLQRSDYLVVPNIAVASDGPVASVALFSQRPATAIRSVAVDSSSRTAGALLRILCAHWFEIEPTLVKMSPDLPTMLKRCDAALLIGDRALFTEYETAGLEKIDLGEEWRAMTDTSFVWSFWAGREGALKSEHLEALQEARDGGVNALDKIAERFAPPSEEDAVEVTQSYLRDNVFYSLGEREREGLKKFFESAVDIGVVPQSRKIRFF
tara:strand:- start:939 stop:1733 length:795 start_codon:yes stop_codon:yes gene_type:complete